MNDEVTANIVRDVLDYDPTTGIFRWKKAYRSSLIGEIAGTKATLGYIRIKIYGKNFAAHRLAWIYHYGRWPSHLIDHIDRDTSNNAICNLREATKSTNAQNANRRGYSKLRKKFQARIHIDGKHICLGTFPTEEEARSAYVAASLKYFGEFSQFHDRGQS